MGDQEINEDLHSDEQSADGRFSFTAIYNCGNKKFKKAACGCGASISVEPSLYVVTLTDYFSKWADAASLPSKHAEGVARHSADGLSPYYMLFQQHI